MFLSNRSSKVLMLKTRNLSIYVSGFDEVSLIDLAGTWIWMNYRKKNQTEVTRE